MANAIVEKRMTASDNVDAYLKTVKLSADAPNGKAVTLGAKVGDDIHNGVLAQSGVVFKITDNNTEIIYAGKNFLTRNPKAWEITVATVTGEVYLTTEPTVNKAVVGKTYGGNDVKNFVNLAGDPITVSKLVVGDVYRVTSDFFTATPTDANNTVTLTAGEWVVSTAS